MSVKHKLDVFEKLQEKEEPTPVTPNPNATLVIPEVEPYYVGNVSVIQFNAIS